ncbi:aminodeoxychorismate synthase, subunit I /aminodeoxychorismate lyase apoprotein [Seinonella peptonophila]|uniref:Aminodeoxychorismate synthase, subunit I /aminodeoxychorismate lyase apoprotein n=1 Tax=Seinonella peptonophila TaxID=112248 RepID=A0A1M4VFZ1_9BACL|nr:aminodeoxychorismate synthase component I [Seinonella peptonophila]SHE67887.1 aminodeoxychorismate synthase, subunit I /aminodeoxychorismate lyase apoprotein [Seinonella peptonophila]
MQTPPTLYFEFEQNPLIFENPTEVIVAQQIDEVLPAIHQIEQRVKSGWYAAGFISYEASPAFDPAFCVKKESQLPLLWFGIFSAPLKQSIQSTEENYSISTWETETSQANYQAAISTIKSHIAAGESYQVNYTLRLSASFQGDDISYYQRLSRAQQSQYSAYLNIGRYRILSASPELFFSFDAQHVKTRPMKGTIQRGLTAAEDEKLKSQLLHSEKEQAENWMIVDLLRNDLSRIAKPGTVKVKQSLQLEQYPTIWTLTSTVTAQRKEATKWSDLLHALFPCGSVTGAPKIKTMEIIDQLETSSREVYCGTIGYLTPSGEGIFNVPIRTVWIDNEQQKAFYGVGGGITWDSTVTGEYNEVFHKAAYLTEERPDFSLLESILLEEGTYALLPYHLKRFATSADYFQFPYSMEEIEHKLLSFAATRQKGSWKVRLLLSSEGRILIEADQLSTLPQPCHVMLAKSPINRSNRFLYHKTTFRQVYDQQQKPAGIFDLLLWNQDGECTEFTIGNLVIEHNGRKYTPPVSSGLLPGTYRQALLEQGEIFERIIYKEDLAKADHIWMINSVRGWVKVNLLLT